MEIKELKTIGEVELNETNKVKVLLKDVNGKNYIDVRKYFLNKEGEEKSTSKGIMVSEEIWSKILPILTCHLTKDEMTYYE